MLTYEYIKPYKVVNLEELMHKKITNKGRPMVTRF